MKKKKKSIFIDAKPSNNMLHLEYKLNNWIVLVAIYQEKRWDINASFKYPKYYLDTNPECNLVHVESVHRKYPPEKWEVIELYKQMKKKFNEKIKNARIAYYENIISKIKNTKITEAEMAGVKCEVCGSFDLEMVGDPEYREDWECKNCKDTLPF